MEYLIKAEELKSQDLSLENIVFAVREYLLSHFENLGKSYS